MFKQALLGIICSVYTFELQASTVEIDLLGKLDDIEEHVSIEERTKHRNVILEIIIKCEFDEQCILNKKGEFEDLAKNKNIIVYSAFLKHLNWEKNDLEYNAKHCQIEDKKAVRKIYAQCYQQSINEETSHPPQTRDDLDLQYDKRLKCIKEKELPLAEAGNIFAQADLVNHAEYFKESAEMQKWHDKLNAIKNTPQFEQFLKCSEIP